MEAAAGMGNDLPARFPPAARMELKLRNATRNQMPETALEKKRVPIFTQFINQPAPREYHSCKQNQV